ncbi:MAG: signal peptidase I [Candidatus Nomurabacteria bacterium]|nr:signal peptidase I [Candidatus Nomurabacteria bacterium]
MIKIALLLTATLSAATVCTFIYYQVFHPSSLWYLGFLALLLAVVWLLVGFRLKRNGDGVAATQIVVVYVLLFLVLIYILGLVTGFLRSGYSHTPLMLIQNILPVVGVVVLTELVRYAIVKRIGDRKGALVGVILAFSALHIVVGSTLYNPTVPMELFEMIGRLILGGIAANVMLTYVAYKSDFRPTITYAVILAVYPIAIPILPDLGPFIYAVLDIILPMLLFMRFNEFFITHRPISGRHKRSGQILWAAPMVAVLATIVILVSGIFRYWAMAIGSDSMRPEIATGDVVIIDKDYGDVENIELGSILAFRHDGQVITHRLIATEHDASGLKIQTKGDNNNNNDAWSVRDSDIVGLVRWKIPLIGWPTVWLDWTF